MTVTAAGPRARAAAHWSRWAELWAELKAGRWSLHFVYVGAAWIITKVYWQTSIQLDVATLKMMMDGTAEAPFAYRVLMPWVLRTVRHLNGVNDPLLADFGVRIFVLYALLLLLRRWMRHFVAPALADLSPLLLGIVLTGTVGWYWPYDFAGFLFWTGCLLALVERRYGWYLVSFTLGCLNRETVFLLIGIFATTQWEVLGRRRTWCWVAGQSVLFVAIAIAIRLLVHAHGGELVEYHVPENLEFMAGRTALGPLEDWIIILSGLGFLWALAPWRWHSKHLFLRRACWLLPVAAVSNFVVGRLAEPRLWNDWIPIALALAGQNLTEFAEEEKAAARASA
jgi:hypothetical protein